MICQGADKSTLFYDNGGSISFKLPTGVLLDIAHDEVLGKGFCLYAPDESFNIRIRCTSSEDDAYVSSDTDYDLLSEITEVNCNSLGGYKATYEDSRALNEELRLDLTGCGEYNFLNICVTIDKDSPTYDEAQKEKILKEVLDALTEIKQKKWASQIVGVRFLLPLRVK